MNILEWAETCLDKRIIPHIIIHNAMNLGPGKSRYIGLTKANSEYIALLDDDDSWHVDKLKIQYRQMMQRSQVLSFTEITYKNNWENFPQENVKVKKIPMWKMYLKNLITTSSVMIHRDLRELMNVSSRYFEDYECWIRVGNSHPLHKIEACLTRIHSHPHQHDGLSSRFLKMTLSELDLYLTSRDITLTHRVVFWITLPLRLTKRIFSFIGYRFNRKI
jgi:glycosyltransferase involved in cell wall biosynthesis